MKKDLFQIIVLLLFSSLGAFSQSTICKLNLGAALAAEDNTAGEEMIILFVRGNTVLIKTAVREIDGIFRYSEGDIASVSIKKNQIGILKEKAFITRIEAANPFSKTVVLNDSMQRHNRAHKAHAGTPPLPQAYKGDNTVIGIIDTGIDFKHPDFKDSTGKSRIRFLWDQVLSDSAPPLPYNYGRQWKDTDIDAGKANSHIPTAEAYTGHGTHVSSVAVGNGRATGKCAGVAPNADIIFVAANLGSSNGIPDAVKYIYDKSASLGKPCVINLSLGNYYGSHDGMNLEAQTVKNLIQAKYGRSMVAASGNAGHIPFHLGYNVSSDTNFTWVSGAAYISIYADTNDLKNVKFAIGADKIAPSYSFRGRTTFSNFSAHLGQLRYDTIYSGSNRLCTIQSYGDLNGGVYSLEYSIIPDTASYYWRLMMTGAGKFNAWTFDFETAVMADTTLFTALKKYKQPDLNSNLVSSYQCLDEVITVGNYVNRNQYMTYDTILRIDSARVPGNLVSSSSHGPTRDGRIKPDVCAPGDWTMAALVTSKAAYYVSVGNSYLMGQGGYHIIDGGTSNASPGVAGVAALYLQMDSTADWQEVKNAIINCARLDQFTGVNLPDNYWGYGKADAYTLLVGCATSNNELQNIDNQYFNIYPNPTLKEITLSEIPAHAKEIILTDLLGKKRYERSIHSNKERLLIDLPAGIYFCTLSDGNKVIATRKLIISE